MSNIKVTIMKQNDIIQRGNDWYRVIDTKYFDGDVSICKLIEEKPNNDLDKNIMYISKFDSYIENRGWHPVSTLSDIRRIFPEEFI